MKKPGGFFVEKPQKNNEKGNEMHKRLAENKKKRIVTNVEKNQNYLCIINKKIKTNL